MDKPNFKVRIYADADFNALVALWRTAGLLAPQNNPRRDIERKLKDSPELLLLGELDGEVVASVMGGYDGHRGWVNYLAVAPAQQGKGIGRSMMTAVEHKLRQLGCPKINLQVRAGNTIAQGFYQRLGYQQDQVISFGLRLEQD